MSWRWHTKFSLPDKGNHVNDFGLTSPCIFLPCSKTFRIYSYTVSAPTGNTQVVQIGQLCFPFVYAFLTEAGLNLSNCAMSLENNYHYKHKRKESSWGWIWKKISTKLSLLPYIQSLNNCYAEEDYVWWGDWAATASPSKRISRKICKLDGLSSANVCSKVLNPCLRVQLLPPQFS